MASRYDTTRTVTSYALAVRATGGIGGYLSDGRWWIVAEGDDPRPLKERAEAMMEFMKSVKGDCVVLRMDQSAFSHRTKITVLVKLLASGSRGVWVDNTIPGQLSPKEREGFEGAVADYFEGVEADRIAALAELARKRELCQEERRATLRRRWIAGAATAAAIAAVSLGGSMVPKATVAMPSAPVSDFERAGGYVVIRIDPETKVYEKYKVWPDGTRALVDRGFPRGEMAR